jgi:branched-chain amino acid transport system permease protein
MTPGSGRNLVTSRAFIVPAVLVLFVIGVLLLGRNVDQGPNPFVVVGLVNGAVFGLVGLGLVIVYKGTRVFNFAQAEMGTLAAYFLFVSIEKLKVPYAVGVLFALVAAVAAGLLAERVFVRPLLNAPRITLLVGTIAMALFAIGVEILVFRIEPENLPAAISASNAAGEPRGIHLFGSIINPQSILIVAVLIGLGVLLAYFFSRTDLGLAVLATSQDPFATRVVGIGVERMSMFIWGSAAFLGAIAGILYVPTIGLLVPGVMTSNILIPAFTGAVLGGMTSLPGAFVGGAVIGLVQALAAWAGGHFQAGTDAAGAPRLLANLIPGIEQVAVLLVLLVVLLARPQGLMGRES